MTRYYTVQTAKFGELVKAADNKAQAIAWARSAFDASTARTVRALREYRFCEDCSSAPCECRKGGA